MGGAVADRLIGKEVLKFREAGLRSASEIAIECGLNLAHYVAEKNSRRFTDKALYAIAQIFGVRTSDIFDTLVRIMP